MRKILLSLMLLAAYVANAAITPADNQMWWGYFTDSDTQNLPYDGNLGYGSACTIDAAIMIPAKDAFVGASTIKAVRLWLGDDITYINSDLTVWIANTRPTSISSAAYKQTVAKASLKRGVNEIELTTPFAVENKSVYVGYTFSISGRAYPVMSNGNDVANSFYYRVNNGDWNNFYGYGYGKLALQILIESESFPTNCASVEDFGQQMVVQGNSVSFPITITNKGKNPIKNFTYTLGSEGSEEVEEHNVSISSLPFNASQSFSASLSADAETTKCQKTITITKVNGEPNGSTANVANGFLITLTEKLPVTPVIEEFTGTWCGWCPRGMVGMEKIHEKYGDQVVQIAGHSGDIMECSDYKDVINAYAGGYPSSIIDRGISSDPSYSSLDYVLSSAFTRTTQGSIQLSASWASAQQKAVAFNTQTKFAYTDPRGQYAIAYMLVEDGLTGTGSNWAQQNYYNGMSGDPIMSFWYTAGSPVQGLEFNHVVVAAWGAKNGVDNSVKAKINAGEVLTRRYTHSISGNTMIQDKSKLKAIVLLIDRSTGTIVNAAQSDIEDYTTGIADIDIEESLMSSQSEGQGVVYDLSGRKINSQLKRGIYIVNGKKILK